MQLKSSSKRASRIGARRQFQRLVWTLLLLWGLFNGVKLFSGGNLGSVAKYCVSMLDQSIPDFFYPVIVHPKAAEGDQAMFLNKQIEMIDAAQANYSVNEDWSITMDKEYSYDLEQPWWRSPKIRRTLYLRPTSGLGNQLQTIASALTLAHLEEFNVKIVFDTMGSYIKFSENFGWADMFAEPKLDFGDVFPGGRKQRSMSCRVHYAFHWHEVRDKWEVGLDGEERLCLRACCLGMFPTKTWIPHTQWFYRALLPAEEPQNIITSFKNKNDWDSYSWVGIHIRRTDRPWRTLRLLRKIPFSNFLDLTVKDYNKVLPVSAVIDQMSLFLSILYPNNSAGGGDLKPVRFFLATDDKSIEPQIMQAFDPGQVLTVAKSLSPRDARLKKSGMHLAVVDLSLLASCQVLIGTAYSSFSKAAAFMGNNMYTEPYYATTWEKHK